MEVQARLYFDTVRHLRVKQVWGWAWEKVPGRRVSGGAGAARTMTGQFTEGYLRPASMLPGGRVRLLNRDEAIGDWNCPKRPRLWNYHLHYFEDPRVSAEWMSKWVRENPVGEGAGWEPYPLSRRVVNWVRWIMRKGGQAGGPVLQQSLALQARVLASTIEYRLLANHLFANAKALVYAGTYFEGREAGGWLRTGLSILDREVGEQIGEDGGHFERSPMYHALILEDLLDLEALRLTYPGVWRERPEWGKAVGRMLGWLGAMTHPDGEMVFFQDACLGVAASYGALKEYAERLGFGEVTGQGARPTGSGYRRLEVGELVAFFDCGSVGPDYQPGHAHAGTLSVEASWRGGRVLVNSGTSTYEAGKERAFERSTAAHGTVRLDGRDSSEMWGAFRVARRARVMGLREGAEVEEVWAEAEHTGYRPARHRRRVTVRVTARAHELVLEDEVTGAGQAEWFFPLHPSIEVRGGELWRAGKRIGYMLPPEGVVARVEMAEWRPEFNLRVPAVRVRMEAPGSGCYETRFCFEGAV